MKKLIALLIVSVVLAGAAFAESRLSFRLRGGWSTIDGGEINDGLAGVQRYYQKTYPVSSGTYPPVHGGYDAGFEVLYQITPKLALGFGLGYLKSESQGMMRRGWTETWTDRDLTTTFSSTPVTLTGYYAFPLASRLRLLAGVGIGYYPTKFSQRDVSQKLGPNYVYDVTWDYTSSKGLFGFQAALDLELDLSPRIAVFLGARYRYAAGSNWSGDTSYNYVENGVPSRGGSPNVKIWIYDFEYVAGATNRHFLIHQNPPTGPSPSAFSNLHEAKLALTGASLGAGFRIKL